MRAEFMQSRNPTQQMTEALQQANQNNSVPQLNLQTQSFVQGSSINFRKPEVYKGKGSITSRIVHMDNFVRSAPPDQALLIAVSFWREMHTNGGLCTHKQTMVRASTHGKA